LFEKRQVVLWNQYGLGFSVSRELDARTRSRSPNEARQILARNCGCYLLSHEAKVASNGFRSTAGVRLLTYSPRGENFSRVFAHACVLSRRALCA